MVTRWANEAARPSQPLKVVQTVCISREPRLKLPKRFGVVCAGVGTVHRASLRSTPVKWTPQIAIIRQDTRPDADSPIRRSEHGIPVKRKIGMSVRNCRNSPNALLRQNLVVNLSAGITITGFANPPKSGGRKPQSAKAVSAKVQHLLPRPSGIVPTPRQG